MAVTPPFNGLSMPVFTAFGWAGEEQAIQFALSQLQVFVNRLYANMADDLRQILPYHGLDRANQAVYLATEEHPEQGVHIVFRAKPLSFIIMIAITDKKLLAKTFKRLDKDPEELYKLLSQLGEGWDLRVQQMEILDGADVATSHYQDIFKDDLDKLTIEATEDIVSRTAYLNSEAQWVAPFYLSHREGSEQVAMVGTGVIRHTNDFLQRLVPLLQLLTNKYPTTKPIKVKKKVVPKAVADKPTSARDLVDVEQLEEFVYIGELKSLHIRKGFINLMTEHWPFFAKNARSTTCDVSVKYGEKGNDKAQVWRLVNTEQTRLVLEGDVQQWLQETFNADERVQIQATKSERGDITLTLHPVV